MIHFQEVHRETRIASRLFDFHHQYSVSDLLRRILPAEGPAKREKFERGPATILTERTYSGRQYSRSFSGVSIPLRCYQVAVFVCTLRRPEKSSCRRLKQIGVNLKIGSLFIKTRRRSVETVSCEATGHYPVALASSKRGH